MERGYFYEEEEQEGWRPNNRCCQGEGGIQIYGHFQKPNDD